MTRGRQWASAAGAQPAISAVARLWSGAPSPPPGMPTFSLVEGTLNGPRYIELLKRALPDILQNHFPRPWPAGGAPIFQQDNATCHKVKGVLEYVRGEQGVRNMEWPPYSPDINLIENFWKMLKEEVWRGPGPQNRAELLARVEHLAAEVRTGAWKDRIVKLYESMTRRLAAVIKSRGWFTKY